MSILSVEKQNLAKGIAFAIISLVFVSIQPIIVVSKPPLIDAYIFAASTCLIEAITLAPFMIFERRKIRTSFNKTIINEEHFSLRLNGWKRKKNLKFMTYVGINFGIAQIFFFLAYQFGGAINISLAQQTTVIFGLIFGYLINHERISKTQIIFSFLLLFGLTLAITQGSFNILEFNIGILFILITTSLWMSAHCLTRNTFNTREIPPLMLAFMRNLISGLFLIMTYFLFFPIENLSLFFNPINLIYFIMMGVIYAIDLACWYKSIDYMKVSKAMVITASMPLLTAAFAVIFLNEIFTYFHLIGSIIIILSIVMILREKE